MLYLYQSNQLERLASDLSEQLQQQPLTDAFAKEVVWVQSQGMGRYLNLFLADTLGICANIEFILPASSVWQLMQRTIVDLPEQNVYTTEVLSWRILSLLQSKQFDAYTVIKQYLKSGDTAAAMLSEKIAGLYDQYLVYRPEWIDAWSQDRLLGLGADEIWQKALWQALIAQTDQPHRVHLWHQLLECLTPEHLPERIHVFGLSSLAPMYLDLLDKFSQFTDVHLFTLNPSREYWGDLIEAATILKQPEDYQHLSLSGHPLLASLGKQGRDFFDGLNECNVAKEHEHFVETEADSLLSLLQNDLLNLRLPQNSHLAGQYLDDKSIQLHSAHSPLRELQILKDQLLAILDNQPELTLNDIAVLTPDIETYTPLIASVFGKTGDDIALPFSITDTRFGHSSPLLCAFEELSAVFQSRFEVEHILSLLEIQPISNKFNLSKQAVDTIRHYVKQMNIHWGADQNMRQLYGDDSDCFTWDAGTKRLALGFMLSDTPETTQTPLWQNTAPQLTSFAHTDVLAQFVLFIETLHQTYLLWQSPCAVDEWVKRLQQLLAQFFLADQENNTALTELEQLFFDLAETAQSAEYQQPLSYELIRHQLNLGLNKKNDRNFLKGGITFCSMVPMRSLPFKVLCLIGLNDTDYPRDEKAVSFDLMSVRPQKGDRSRRDDDRYLFLESIISVRQQLYLSYIGKDIKTDEALPASPLVNELLDTLATMTGLAANEIKNRLVVKHPLQAFSKQYFLSGQTDLFSYQQHYALALGQVAPDEKIFLDIDIQTEAGTQIQLPDFILFWRNPIRYWLKKNLGWQASYLKDTQQSEEPFYLDRVREEAILRQLMQDKINHRAFERSVQLFNAQNLLPAGELGRLSQTDELIKIKSMPVPEILKESLLSPIDFQLDLDNNTTLAGTLSCLYPSGRAISQPYPPNAPEYIAFLLNHLLLCALTPKLMQDHQSFLFNTEKNKQLTALPQAQALQLLNDWLAYYRMGQNTILPFFPRTHIETAQIYLKNKEKTDAQVQAMASAHKTFYGNRYSEGEALYYPENRLVFQEQKPLENPLFWIMTEKLLIPLLALENKKE